MRAFLFRALAYSFRERRASVYADFPLWSPEFSAQMTTTRYAPVVVIGVRHFVIRPAWDFCDLAPTWKRYPCATQFGTRMNRIPNATFFAERVDRIEKHGSDLPLKHKSSRKVQSILSFHSPITWMPDIDNRTDIVHVPDRFDWWISNIKGLTIFFSK